MWWDCPKSSEKYESAPGIRIKVSSATCVACNLQCEKAVEALLLLLPRHITEMPVPKKHKITSMRRGFPMRNPCVLKPDKNCWVASTYCEYNNICPVNKLPRQTKTLRWQEVNMYMVKMNGEAKFAENVDGINPTAMKSTDSIYKIAYALVINMELVPVMDANAGNGALEKKIEDITTKFGTTIITKEGKELDLKTWFGKASEKDVAFIAGGKMVPVKTLSLVPAAKFFNKESKPVEAKPLPQTNKVEEVNVKRKRRTAAEMAKGG